MLVEWNAGKEICQWSDMAAEWYARRVICQWGDIPIEWEANGVMWRCRDTISATAQRFCDRMISRRLSNFKGDFKHRANRAPIHAHTCSWVLTPRFNFQASRRLMSKCFRWFCHANEKKYTIAQLIFQIEREREKHVSNADNKFPSINSSMNARSPSEKSPATWRLIWPRPVPRAREWAKWASKRASERSRARDQSK